MLIWELLTLYVCLSPLIALLQRTVPLFSCLSLSAEPLCSTCHLASAVRVAVNTRLWGGGTPASPQLRQRPLLLASPRVLGLGAIPPSPLPLPLFPCPRGSPETPLQTAAWWGGIEACPRLVILTSDSNAHGSEQLAYLTHLLLWWLGR